MLLERVQEFFGTGRTVTIPTPIIVPTYHVPIPIAVPSLLPLRQAPMRGNQIKKSYRLLRDRFSRASREPITLSPKLIPERDETAEIMEKRYVDLFA